MHCSASLLDAGKRANSLQLPQAKGSRGSSGKYLPEAPQYLPRDGPGTGACPREGGDPVPGLPHSDAGRVSRPAAGRFANLWKTESRAREHGLDGRQWAAPRSGARVAPSPVVFLKPVREYAPDHLGSGELFRLFRAQPVQCLDHDPWKADHYGLGILRRSAHEDFSSWGGLKIILYTL